MLQLEYNGGQNTAETLQPVFKYHEYALQNRSYTTMVFSFLTFLQYVVPFVCCSFSAQLYIRGTDVLNVINDVDPHINDELYII